VRAVLALIGCTAVAAQIVLMRELMVAFCGNELSIGILLANWLLWTAAGSALLGHIGLAPRKLVAALETAVALALPLTIVAVRVSKQVFQRVPGEILGPGAMLLISFVALSLFCALNGWLFAAASRLCALEWDANTAQATAAVYLYEAIGSGAGGLLAGIALARSLGAFDIALLVSLANLAAAAGLALRSPIRRSVAILALAAGFAVFVFPDAKPWLESFSLARLWRGLRVVATRNSVFGNLVVTETRGSRSLFENGLAAFSAPDPEAAEEAVHYALLEHPQPHSLLLIGGGANGSLAQSLQHESLERVDYVELDPAVLDLARKYFPNSIPADRRLRVHHTDGRLFLKTAAQTYDVILVDLPDPQTAQLNRFYTLEFFREAAAKLAPGGVFSFQVTAAEDYISPELADFLRCLRKTLRQAFPEVTAIPGGTVHFFAAARPGVLLHDPREIVSRMRQRGLQTSYVREYFIPFRMMPDRMRDLDAQIAPRPGTPVNRDFAPIAYYFDTVLWSSRFERASALREIARLPFGALAGAVALLALASAALLRRRVAAIAGASVAAMGFTLIGLELLILLEFQAQHGYVYHQLAIVIAALMAGMALGAWRAVRGAAGLHSLALVQLLAAFAGLALCLLFGALGQFQALFPAAALVCGFLGGYQFPVASRVFFPGPARSPGTLYGLDLAGACLGAVALSLYLVPVFGFVKTALLMAIVNAAPAALLWTSGRRTPAP
jgi:spermidine synthase